MYLVAPSGLVTGMTIPTTDAGGAAHAAAPFAVTAPANLVLDGRNGKTTFTVTNLSGRPVRARIKPRGGAGAEDSWFAVAGQPEVPMAVGATATVEVTVAVPRKTAPGNHTLLLEVVAEDDTEVVTGQSVSFTVQGTVAKKSPILAMVIIVVVLLLLGAAAVWYFVLRDPGVNTGVTPNTQPSAGQSQTVPNGAPKMAKNKSLPKVAGTPQVGSELSVQTYGSWSPKGLVFLAQWQRCDDDDCTDIDDATKKTYTPTAEDVDHQIRVLIKARGKGVTETTAESAKHGPIVAAEPADACVEGFTWRLVIAEDHVCVTPETAAQVVEDNRLRFVRWTNGDYGPQTCVNGYVWREAFPSDLVCVTGAVRSQTAEDNRLASSRVKGR